MKRFCPALLLVTTLLFLTSCATTSYRIKKNQDLFDSYDAEVQEKIKAGEVDIGFTKAMVMIALGKPVRERTRKTKDGLVDVWVWPDYQYTYERQMTRGNFRYKDNNGRTRVVSDNIWVDVQNKTEYDRLRIEFNDENKVVAIESID